MPGLDFIAWLSSREVDLAGKLPRSPIKRASLLFELALSGKVDADEMKEYFKEIGLMVPIEEN
ncbi:MAG: hypothetical protein SCH70_07760 [Candidatus Methanoperedens sp.]|nr:hypothetical protein [Candidatus Methanoperedens sp.]